MERVSNERLEQLISSHALWNATATVAESAQYHKDDADALRELLERRKAEQPTGQRAEAEIPLEQMSEAEAELVQIKERYATYRAASSAQTKLFAAQIELLKEQLRDNDLAFAHANELIGKYMKDADDLKEQLAVAQQGAKKP